MKKQRIAVAAVVVLAGFFAGGSALAAGPSKDECVDAHSKGQDARDQGKLSLARKLFLTCAQPSCPGLVQGDCARFTDDLSRAQPTASFGARDDAGADLPDTAVYVDDVLVAARLDDGKPHDIDPGKHSVRFSNSGRDQTQVVVIEAGEKGRSIVATFPSPGGPRVNAPGGQPAGSTQGPPPPEPTRSAAPLALVAIGGAGIVAGVVLGIVGLNKVPSSCSISDHQCAAPPGDPAFDDAHSGVTLGNVGLIVGVAGAVVATTGLVWYAAEPKVIRTGKATKISPWFAGNAGGLVVSGKL